MPIDASIPLGVRQVQIESPVNALAQVLQVQQAQNTNKLADYSLGKAKRQDEEMNALSGLLRDGGIDLSTPEGQSKAYSVAPTTAATIIKGHLDNRKIVSDIGASDATAKAKTIEAAHKRMEMMGQTLGWLKDNPSAENAQLVVQHFTDSGLMTDEQAKKALERVQSDPTPQGIASFATLGYQAALSAKDQLPTYHTRNTGGTTDTLAINPVTQKVTVASSAPITQSADNAATNATHVQTTGMTNATSRDINAANIKKDYNVAGLNSDGTPGAANDSMVDAIGQYKVAPPNGMALRNPRMQQILADVTAKYPDFDATQYGARQVAAKAFSTGKDGQSVQSANTALNHLGTLKELAAAQNNGDIRLFNTIANRFATETGGTAPTNLAAAVTMVGPEISRAVIGAGGGQGDREKVDSALAALTKGGKAQAAGTLATMEDLFGGRLTEAQRTYERTTGRKDFPTTFLSPAAQKVLAARGGGVSGPDPKVEELLKKYGR